MRPSDLIAVFAPRFDAAGIDWMIARGVASIVYGEPRLTQDLDIVARIPPGHAERFVRQFPEPDFYCAPPQVIAEEASRDKPGHFNVLHNATGGRADVYLAGEDPLTRRGLAERRVIEVMGTPTPIAPPEYVILHKLRFRQQGASERHLRDIRAMLRVLGSSVDIAALSREAETLGLAEQWREMDALRE